MDDLFQILIYLLIIISFLAPVFRKKNQPKKTDEKQGMRMPGSDVPVNSAPRHYPAKSQQQDYDVLKELENFFKVGTEDEKDEVIPTAKGTVVNEYQTEPEPVLKTQSIDYQSMWEKKKAEVENIVSSVDKNIEMQAKKFQEQIEDRKILKTNDLIIRLRKNLSNPATLREYFVFSEIIGKPKSRRR